MSGKVYAEWEIGEFEQKDLLEHLKVLLDDVCCSLAAKFNLYDSAGRPRRAFILDSLLRFSCIGCLQKVLAQVRVCGCSVDALYCEMHGFAVNVLSGVLMEVLNGGCFSVCCEDADDYGRVDVAVKPAGFGVVVEAKEAHVVVEIKVGKSLSFAQLFRYLIGHPDAILVVWRVGMRQVFTLRGRELQTLLCIYILSAISRGLKLLSSKALECSHNPNLNKTTFVSNPQRLLEEFFHGLAESLPKAVSAVTEALKEAGLNAD